MNKCHSNLNWLNDTVPAINDTNLNYMDGCIDTIDDRVVAMDTAKLEAEDVATVIKSVSIDDETGVLTFVRYDDTTFTVDTKLEKVVTNWTYDKATQSLVLTLADKTTVSVPLSDFITETEVADTTTVALTLVDHKLTANVVGHSIGDDQMQTGYLTDCQTARNGASTAATNANTNRLVAEGYAVGTQDGIPVGPDSIFFRNNARFWSDKASGQQLSALNDVSLSAPENNQSLVYEDGKWVNKEVKAGRTEEIVNDVLYATNWTGSEAPYSYDLGIASGYDFEVNLTNAVTKDMIDSIMSYTIIGNMSDNILRAFGEKPEIDIPIIIRKWEREVS